MNEKMFRLDGSGFSLRAGALVGVFTLACIAPSAPAQVVRAPRYQGAAPPAATVDAPLRQLNLPPLPPAKTPNGTVVEDVVVRINDQIISRSDVERGAQQMEQEAASKNMSPGDLANAQKDMLRDMIDQQLLLSRAKELGLNVDAEVVRQLDEIRKSNNMASMDDLEKAARQQGVSFEDFKAHIRDQDLTQQVVRDEVGRRLQLSQAAETTYYQAHLKDFEQPEQVRLSEILVPLPESATPAEIVQAEHKADDLKTQIMKGQDFAAVAKKASGGPTAAQGGELGLFKRGTLAKVLEDQTFDLPVGQSTQPIRTRQGFVILKTTEHVQAGPAPLKDVEPKVQEAMYMEEMQPALRAYLTKLRENAYVDVQPGFVDSGGSAGETKPVFTAYVAPAVKKKKVKDKARFDRGGRYTTVSAPAKRAVVSSPDTTGTRTITGPDAAPAVDPKTGLGLLPPAKSPATKSTRREKVRFGQAPRNALPGGGTDGESTALAAPEPTSAQPVALASSSNLDSNPLDPVAPERKKTRFAAQAAEHKEKKVAAVSAKQQEKLAATPVAMSTDEKAAAQTQAAPLGLAGNTAPRKPKKLKREKGAPKQRLEDQKKAEPAAPVQIAPTANPALAPTSASDSPAGSSTPRSAPSAQPDSPGPAPVPAQPDTTLPSTTPAPPGAPPPV